MNYCFKVSRRIARFRGPVVAALVLTVASCNQTDPVRPDSTSSPQSDLDTDTEPTYFADPTAFAWDSVRMATPSNPVTSAKSCLTQSGPLVTLSGAQQRYYHPKLPPNLKVDAGKAWWDGAGGFPVLVGNSKAAGLCWSGGLIRGTWPVGTPWLTYHSTAGMFMAAPGFTLEDVKIVNYGDAVRVQNYTDNWTIRRIHVQRARDDCIENDRLYSGLIDDALFEGCYVFLSERPGSGVGIPVDGRKEMVKIQNTLVYLQPMPSVYSGRPPGTGPLFKWSNLGSKLAITNTIFRIDQKPNHGDLKFPPGLVSCANNTIVWLGKGSYPAPLPSCFTVTTDRAVWERAVIRWKATHQQANFRRQ